MIGVSIRSEKSNLRLLSGKRKKKKVSLRRSSARMRWKRWRKRLKPG
jgi:hypothetical protein